MSVIHTQQNFHCGDDWDFAGPIQSPGGTVINLTGATITWKLVSLDYSTTYLILGIGTGVTITDPTNGLVAYGPTGTQTAPLTPGTYYDLLRVILQDGTDFTAVEGIINVAPKPN